MRGGWIESNEIILDVIFLEDTKNGFHGWFKALVLEVKKGKMYVLVVVVVVVVLMTLLLSC